MIAAPARFVIHTIGGAIDAAREWPVRAQRQARRNAMVAATSCTARRAASDDALAFLSDRDAAVSHLPSRPAEPAPARRAR